jgi:GDPmannose 4,6-dehydratase
LYLGNIDSLRDWGHARDYVMAQWMILQHSQPDDFVVATGEQHSVREFVELAGAHLGMRITWEGAGVAERGVDQSTGRTVVRIDPRYFRPTEVDTLLGDPSKAKRVLGWCATTSFPDLVREMVMADLSLAKRDGHVTRGGFKAFVGHE